MNTGIRAEYINHMGDDLMVVNSARVSFNKESEFVPVEHPLLGVVDVHLSDADAKLIGYLARHNHWTPFSHPQITLRETVPIFVARQRFKHMVGFTYNEVSRRYVDDEPEFFVPDVWRSRPEGSVKQGSGDVRIDEIIPLRGAKPCSVSALYAEVLDECLHLYNSMIARGIAPEQARMVLPQSMLTSYYVTGSLAAFARAYKQRIDSHAQQEIQQLAQQWGSIIEPLFPVSWAALTEAKPQ